MGRKSNTATRRAQIVEALLAEMAAVGFERASTKSIAKRAGLAPGLVHYHFKNKQEILLALIEELIASADARFELALSSPATARQKLQSFVTLRVGLGSSSDLREVRAWIQLMAEAMAQPKVKARLGHWLTEDKKKLARLFEEAQIKASANKATTLLAMILGSFCLHAFGPIATPGYAEKEITGWLNSL